MFSESSRHATCRRRVSTSSSCAEPREWFADQHCEDTNAASSADTCLAWVLSLLVCSCGSADMPVHFIIPDGYRGLFRVKLNKAAAAPDRIGDHVQLNVPASGLLEIRTLKIFRRWHKERAFYENGTELRNDRTVPTSMENEVLFSCLQAVGDHTLIYVVGTREEIRAAN